MDHDIYSGLGVGEFHSTKYLPNAHFVCGLSCGTRNRIDSSELFHSLGPSEGKIKLPKPAVPREELQKLQKLAKLAESAGGSFSLRQKRG
jgi:hypothetical protein